MTTRMTQLLLIFCLIKLSFSIKNDTMATVDIKRSDLVYGCFCGPGKRCNVPKNPVDRVCYRHDQCYGKKGYAHCKCEKDLITRMTGAISSTTDPKGKAVGALALALFSISPCKCHICIRVPYCKLKGWKLVCGMRKSCSKLLFPNFKTCPGI